MKRREFIALLSGAATLGPVGALARQPERVRRIGSLNVFAETDPEVRSWDAAFRQRLDELGWVDGRNVHFDYRWGAGSFELLQTSARQLVQLNPDVIFSVGTPATAVLQAQTRKIPIVFASVSDPVGTSLVASLESPGGNITGFMNMASSLSSKWFELIHDVAPYVSRVAFMFNPSTAPHARDYLATFRSAASALAVEPIELPVQNSAEIEAAMTNLGREAGAGLIIMSDNSMVFTRELIISLSSRYRLPTIYPYRFFATGGGLMSYGVDNSDLFQRAASYVDRILRGEKPNKLPVEQATKFELVINLKTAKAMGVTVPEALLARADKVIE